MEIDELVQALYNHALVEALTHSDVGSLKLAAAQLAHALATGDEERAARVRRDVGQVLR